MSKQEDEKDTSKDGNKMMGSRGVSRPMAMKQMKQHHDKQQKDDGGMDRDMMLHMHHKQTLWIYWVLILLGLWTMAAPFAFGYWNNPVQPAGGRDVWLAQETRIQCMIWSDLISGLLLVIFGWRGLLPNRPISLWLACGVGVWMSFAPILFWSPSAAAYYNDTFVGALIIALTILIPGMPNMINYMKMGPEQPPGWSYNPSSWPQRSIMIAAGFAGWLVSRYVAMFQLGYIDQVWDPFFAEGSRLVLTSKMSEALPISDGALGTFAYTLEFLMGWMGSPSRWRTMPWMVALFGILVIPLGLVHIFLVASQPVIIGEWCTMCLLAAAIMLPMIPLEIDEVIAMMQFMKKKKREGMSLWMTFWKGGTVDGGGSDKRTPEMIAFPRQPMKVTASMFWGMTFPVTLVITTLIGVWLMGAPAVLETQKPMMDVTRICGALAITISVVCMGEPLRLGRYLNLLVGATLIMAPFLAGGGTTLSLMNSLAAGILLIVLSIPRGPINESFSTWDKLVR